MPVKHPIFQYTHYPYPLNKVGWVAFSAGAGRIKTTPSLLVIEMIPSSCFIEMRTAAAGLLFTKLIGTKLAGGLPIISSKKEEID